MGRQPDDLLTDFSFDFGFGTWILWIHGAGKHHILPNHDAILIAKFVEVFRFVCSAAPYSHHIGMGVNQILNRTLISLVVEPRHESVVRTPVITACMNWNVIDDDFASAADFISFGIQSN